MKQRFWLFKRGSVFYLQDSETGKKESLKTRDSKQAERLRAAKNEAAEKPLLGLTLGKAYLSAYDPKLVERKWAQMMDEFGQRGRDSSRARYARALKSAPLAALRDKKIVDTTSDDLRVVLADNKPSTNHFLRRVHNLAVGMGWLPWPIIPAKMWPTIQLKRKRGITPEQHQRIIAAEGNAERRHLYELLREVGAAQTDAVMLTADNIDWSRRVLSYQRCKTGEWAYLVIGERLDAPTGDLTCCIHQRFASYRTFITKVLGENQGASANLGEPGNCRDEQQMAIYVERSRWTHNARWRRISVTRLVALGIL